jgi:hypothetical protein
MLEMEHNTGHVITGTVSDGLVRKHLSRPLRVLILNDDLPHPFLLDCIGQAIASEHVSVRVTHVENSNFSIMGVESLHSQGGQEPVAHRMPARLTD